MSFLGGAPFAQDLESAFAKIQEALPARSLPYLARIQELFAARPDPWKDYSKKQDVIAALIDATLHQRQARIEYFSFNSRRTKATPLDPYRLVYYHGGLYLYARAAGVRRGAHLRGGAHRDDRGAGRDFEMPADFNVSEYARAAPSASRAASRSRWSSSSTPRWPATSASASGTRARSWRRSPDGSVVLRMNVAPGWELKAWIKGFLPHVRVVKPAALRDEIARELEEAGSGSPPSGAEARPGGGDEGGERESDTWVPIMVLAMAAPVACQEQNPPSEGTVVPTDREVVINMSGDVINVVPARRWWRWADP